MRRVHKHSNKTAKARTIATGYKVVNELANVISECNKNNVDFGIICDTDEVNKVNEKGDTLLTQACYLGNVNIVEILLKAGASMCEDFEMQHQPLLIALYKEKYECAKLLIPHQTTFSPPHLLKFMDLIIAGNTHIIEVLAHHHPLVCMQRLIIMASKNAKTATPKGSLIENCLHLGKWDIIDKVALSFLELFSTPEKFALESTKYSISDITEMSSVLLGTTSVHILEKLLANDALMNFYNRDYLVEQLIKYYIHIIPSNRIGPTMIMLFKHEIINEDIIYDQTPILPLLVRNGNHEIINFFFEESMIDISPDVEILEPLDPMRVYQHPFNKFDWLSVAVLSGDVDIVRLFMDKGAYIYISDLLPVCMMCAITHNLQPVLKYLMTIPDMYNKELEYEYINFMINAGCMNVSIIRLVCPSYEKYKYLDTRFAVVNMFDLWCSRTIGIENYNLINKYVDVNCEGEYSNKKNIYTTRFHILGLLHSILYEINIIKHKDVSVLQQLPTLYDYYLSFKEYMREEVLVQVLVLLCSSDDVTSKHIEKFFVACNLLMNCMADGRVKVKYVTDADIIKNISQSAKKNISDTPNYVLSHVITPFCKDVYQVVKCPLSTSMVDDLLYNMTFPKKVPHRYHVHKQLVNTICILMENPFVVQIYTPKCMALIHKYPQHKLNDLKKPTYWFKRYAVNIGREKKDDSVHMFPFYIDSIIFNFRAYTKKYKDKKHNNKYVTCHYFYGALHIRGTETQGVYEYIIDEEGNLFHRMFMPIEKVLAGDIQRIYREILRVKSIQE